MKTCIWCKDKKDVRAFGILRKEKSGRRPQCKLCWNHYVNAWKAKHPGIIRNQKLRNRYGIEQKDYLKMFSNQFGKCAICALPQAEQIKPLEIDHCHLTNRIRGLLCQNCNKVLGLMDDNVNLLYAAASYLEGLRVS